ncbi:MAG: PEP-CTERM sorting domain-containing protein [Planctomycetia bacterium]|nr:PEP-CTERM sorting domain-containing protein [Planctomycetia bacterium]
MDSDVVFQSTQQTTIDARSTLHVNGAASYLGGTFTGPGTLQHNGTALLSSSNPLSATRFLQNGLLTAINPANTATIDSAVIDFLPGSVTRLFTNLHLQGRAIIRPDATFEGNGTLVIDLTASLTAGGILGVDLENQGTVRPGYSPGVLSVAGDYLQGPSAALQIELAGTNRGDWDQLSASGSVSLDGTLNVFLFGGFTPLLGDSFTIVSASGGLSGKFGNLALPALPVGQFWSIDYSRTAVVLSTTNGLLGDTNGDQKVDIQDLNNVRNNFGGTGLGDTDDNGTVDISDLNNVRNNFGIGNANPVPEPNTYALATIGLIGLAGVIWQRKRR